MSFKNMDSIEKGIMCFMIGVMALGMISAFFIIPKLGPHFIDDGSLNYCCGKKPPLLPKINIPTH